LIRHNDSLARIAGLLQSLCGVRAGNLPRPAVGNQGNGPAMTEAGDDLRQFINAVVIDNKRLKLNIVTPAAGLASKLAAEEFSD
jgi:hypothetical protein